MLFFFYSPQFSSSSIFSWSAGSRTGSKRTKKSRLLNRSGCRSVFLPRPKLSMVYILMC